MKQQISIRRMSSSPFSLAQEPFYNYSRKNTSSAPPLLGIGSPFWAENAIPQAKRNQPDDDPVDLLPQVKLPLFRFSGGRHDSVLRAITSSSATPPRSATTAASSSIGPGPSQSQGLKAYRDRLKLEVERRRQVYEQEQAMAAYGSVLAQQQFQWLLGQYYAAPFFYVAPPFYYLPRHHHHW
jgi:hypothetical protein